MRSFSNILPNFATNLHLLVDSINEEIITKIVKKLTNYLHIQEKNTIFAADFKQVNKQR